VSSFTRRTVRGRVVYDRKRHVFSYRDIARILRDSIGSYEADDPWNVLLVVDRALDNALARLLDLVMDFAQLLALAGAAGASWIGIAGKFGQLLIKAWERWSTQNAPISLPETSPLFPPMNPFGKISFTPEARTSSATRVPDLSNPVEQAIRRLHADLSTFLEQFEAPPGGKKPGTKQKEV
jgi:hypothetical protein